MASAVQTVFERLQTSWEFDKADVLKLWGALCEGAGGSGFNKFANLLLVFIQAPEAFQECEGARAIPNLVNGIAHEMPLEPAATKDRAEETLSTLLHRLASWIRQPAVHNRVRCMELIVAIMRGVPRCGPEREGARLRAEDLGFVVERLREHLNDTDAKVRELAVVALCRIMAPEEGLEAANNPAFADVVELLHCERNKEVRAAIVIRLPLDSSTLDDVLRHARDVPSVAAEVYNRAARELPLLQPAQEGGVSASPGQRKMLLWSGLHESRPEVCKAAQGLLAKWFSDDAAGDVTVLLRALQPQENAELCELVLSRLVDLSKWEPQAWLKAAAESGSSPRTLAAKASAEDAAPWVACVTPELAYVWVFACRAVERAVKSNGQAAATRVAVAAAQADASVGAQAEAVLESFLPTAQDMAAQCLLAARAGPQHRYAASKLVELSALEHMNWVDASSRATANSMLWALVTTAARPDEPRPPHGSSSSGFLPPVGCGGSGAWEAGVLALAAKVFGTGVGLVEAVLPMVLRLAEALGVDATAPETAEEGPLLQVLTYLRLLMAAAGPAVPPNAGTRVAGAAGGQDEEEEEQEEDGEAARNKVVTLEQAVARLAWNASAHGSPAVRAAAIRCHVVLCLRVGGLERQLPRALAMIAPLLPTCVPRGGGSDGAAGDRETVEWQQLPRRAAVQGLVDLAAMWGEPTVTGELRAVVAAAAGRRRLEAVTARMAEMGMEVDGEGSGGEPVAEEEEEAEGAAAPPVLGVVPTLLRLTEGLARKMQGWDSFTEASGPAADALLGAMRLLHLWHRQRKLHQHSRQHPHGTKFTAMQPQLAEQLLARLLLVRFSPALEDRPVLRADLEAFLHAYKDTASAPGDEGALHRRLLADAFLPAARCAMALPPQPTAAATAKCGAPALMEFAAELLAGASTAAAAAQALAAAGAQAAQEDDEDEDDVRAGKPGAAASSGEGDTAAEVLDTHAATHVCCMALEELALVAVERALPGVGSSGQADKGRRRRSQLDTHSDKAAQAYTEELCKTPLRLLPCLASAPAGDIPRLVFLGRRALRFTEAELRPNKVVPEMAVKKLKEFVAEVEGLQKDNSAPMSEEEAGGVIQALLEQLDRLPRQQDVQAVLQLDEDWDLPSTSDQQPAASGRRSSGSRASKGTASSGRGSRARAPAAKATGRARCSDLRAVSEEEDDDDNDVDDDSSSGGESEVADTGARASKGRAKARAPAKASAPAARPATSQDSAASAAAAATSTAASQGERRSSRAAAAKATARLQGMKDKDKATARLVRLSAGGDD